MELKTQLLEDLMKKYEKSKHFRQPHQSHRRVFLSKEKKEMKGYNWESVASNSLFAEEALFLEAENLIQIQWEVPQKVLWEVSLNLENVEKAYGLLGKIPPWQQAEADVIFLEKALSAIHLPWLCQWKTDLLSQIAQTWKPPSFLLKGQEYGEKFCALLCAFQSLPESGLTLRSFSIQVFHHSKDLEKQYLSDFLKVLKDYHPEVSLFWKDMSLTDKEILQLVGITPRGEQFSLSGNMRLTFSTGVLDLGAVGKWGLALTGESSKDLEEIALEGVEEIFFIENKTNYEDFLHERKEHQAALYHGGFFSPSKGAFFRKFVPYVQGIPVYFWGDIDLGGFCMFGRLQEIFPDLLPYAMGAEEVEAYGSLGLPRSVAYLEKLEERKGEFPLFQEAIEGILSQGVTIEQEVFLIG